MQLDKDRRLEVVVLTSEASPNSPPQLLDSQHSETAHGSSSYRHKWQLEQKFVLKTLVEVYKNGWKDVTAVFNEYYRDAINSPDGISARTLKAQYHEIQKPKPRSQPDPLIQVVITSTTSSLSSDEDLKSSLEATASTLRITLTRNETASRPPSSLRSRKMRSNKRKLGDTTGDDEGWMTDVSIVFSSDSEDGSVYSPPPKRVSRHLENTFTWKKKSNIGLPTPESSARPFRQPFPVRASPTPLARTMGKPVYSSSRVPRRRRESTTPRPFPRSPTPSATIKSRSGRRRHGPVPFSMYKLDMKPIDLKRRLSYSRTLRSTFNASIKGPVEIPQIGFRGYSAHSQGTNSESGFRAGAFTDVDKMPPCPNIEDAQYLLYATKHVANDKSAPSPFISVSFRFR